MQQPDLFDSKADIGRLAHRETRKAEAVAVARGSDPVTSHEAAASVKGIRNSQQVILNVLRDHGPMSDGEIRREVAFLAIARMSPSGARTRRKELVDMGLVRDSGQRQLTPSGRNTIVWEAVSGNNL